MPPTSAATIMVDVHVTRTFNLLMLLLRAVVAVASWIVGCGIWLAPKLVRVKVKQ